MYRSGRLDKIYELNIKKPDQRLQILKIMTKSRFKYDYFLLFTMQKNHWDFYLNWNEYYYLEIPFIMEEKDLILKKVSQITHGFVATDLQNLCTKVAMELIQKISNEKGDEVWNKLL